RCPSGLEDEIVGGIPTDPKARRHDRRRVVLLDNEWARDGTGVNARAVDDGGLEEAVVRAKVGRARLPRVLTGGFRRSGKNCSGPRRGVLGRCGQADMNELDRIAVGAMAVGPLVLELEAPGEVERIGSSGAVGRDRDSQLERLTDVS